MANLERTPHGHDGNHGNGNGKAKGNGKKHTWKSKLVQKSTPVFAKSPLARRTALWVGEQYIHHKNKDRAAEGNSLRPPGVIADRTEMGQAILHTADRLFASNVSPAVIQRAMDIMVEGIMMEGNDKSVTERFFEQYGTHPPSFMTIAPGKACNLNCIGCYANAGIKTTEKLDWDTFDRILTEAKELWGVRFMVITGGEPLAYRSHGKDLLDAVEKHPDMIFMMYTNGTLIGERKAKRMAELGNITPAISLEGWRESTDHRRGKGVFDKVIAAMDRLRTVGVPFGISLTATRYNAEEILSDEFMDFLFFEQGAIYGWLFHYMPIGRAFTLDLMPTVKQRVWMWERVWEIIREKHIFLADFWNHATLSDGCIAGGRARGGGYFYIDWNGTVAPCVFVPYSPVNVKDVYANGGDLNTVWEEPFFSGIRDWQQGYWDERENWLAPCLIRDHHSELRRLIAEHEPDPSDDSALAALLDPEYARGLAEYDAEYMKATKPIWEEYYLKEGTRWQVNGEISKSIVAPLAPEQATPSD